MKVIQRVVQLSLLGRLWNCCKWAVQRVRLHPAARIEGGGRSLAIGRGTKIGPGCVIEVGAAATISVGAGCWFYRDVELRSDGELTIGARTTLQKGVTLNGNVRIGSDCIFAANIFISSGTHVYDRWPALPINRQDRLLAAELIAGRGDGAAARYDRPVDIGEDCWIGVNAVIMPGVVIGRGCVVGAGSVVTKSIAPYCVVAGVPAKPLAERMLWTPPMVLEATHGDAIPYLYEGFDVHWEGGVMSARMGPRVRVALACAPAGALEVVLVAPSLGLLRLGDVTADIVAGNNRLVFPLPAYRQPGLEYRVFEFFLSSDNPDGSVVLLSCKLLSRN